MEWGTIDARLETLARVCSEQAPELFDLGASRRLYVDVVLRSLAHYVPAVSQLIGRPLSDGVLRVPLESEADVHRLEAITRLVQTTGQFLVPVGARELYWWSMNAPRHMMAVCLDERGICGIYPGVPIEEAHESLLPCYPYEPPGLLLCAGYMPAPAYLFDRAYMTVTEASEEACMPVATLRWQLAHHRIPGAMKRGKTWLVPRPVVRAVLKPIRGLVDVSR